MKNGKKIIGYFLLFIICSLRSISQDADSVLHIPKNAFFNKIFQNKELEIQLPAYSPYRFVDIKSPILRNKYLLFIKNKQGMFAHFDGTSRIYKQNGETDSTYIFQRLDRVENINYNINAYFFSHHGTFYNYGGYGFWKNNGLLRRFNIQNREWDIVPLNKEILCDSEKKNIWYRQNDSLLYIIADRPVNEGIINKEKNANQLTPNAYRLNLSTKHVEKLGVLNDLVIPSILISNRLHTDEGILLVKVPNSYYIKPKENKLYQVDEASIIQTLGRLEWECLVYYNQGKFHFWDLNKNIIDSIDIKNIKLKPIGNIWNTDWADYYLVGGALLFLIGGLVLGFSYSSKKKNIISIYGEEGKTNIVSVPILSETEISLIRLLVDKSEQKEFASSNEINYIIGCKDKNVGLQKKMRSDIINSINTKYKAFSKTNQNLVESKRTEFDKRYFHYHITEDQLEKARIFLELTAGEA